ncbi:NAD-dependent epimerase/dehydratase family protein [Lacisediminihabitans changchengi]|uniref:NAD(P)-dependent oxidoreductase n=1 Tax=Lacisediminihabitans changchengi TaxID=2787634 RepID=A0A934SSA1_9MICO|nr:NAD(P)-dependent oxidoreductase [Lacisediminihabitans changchengi]MBK4347204.1 NAD(P)-dependent oxidoreductase [Lacisediminihabitans changchengi]
MTGTNGFVGGAVARALAADGHDVDAYTRQRWDITAGPLSDPAETVKADAVVHCAALADDWAPLDRALRVNVEGTRNVVQSFPGARFVHLSTSSVYDAFAPTITAAESAAPCTRYLSTYSRSKAEAEAVLPADAVVLRPHAVYGSGDTTLLPRVLAGIRRRRLFLPDGARVLHSLTHIDNLVQAVRLSLGGRPGVYNVADEAPVLLSEVLTELLAKQGRPDVVLRRIPYRTAFAAATVAEKLPGRPRLTRYAVSQLGLERTLDLTAIRTHLGYRPTATSLSCAEHW